MFKQRKRRTRLSMLRLRQKNPRETADGADEERSDEGGASKTKKLLRGSTVTRLSLLVGTILVAAGLLRSTVGHRPPPTPASGASPPAAPPSWCDRVAAARAGLAPSLRISVPCEGMAAARSAVVVVLTAGVPDGKESRTVFSGTDYVNGALALGASLRDHLTRKDTHRLLLVKEGFTLPGDSIAKLEAVGWKIGKSPDVQVEAKYVPRFARYKNVYPKIAVIGLAEYECVLLLDADALAVGSVDDLLSCAVLDRPEYRVAGALDYYHGSWFHFNTGAVLWRPDAAEMTRVYNLTRDPAFMRRFESDQIFLNTVYPDRTDRARNKLILEGDGGREGWGSVAHLPWAYNAQTHVEYQLPAFWDEHLADVRILHFTEKKGWQCPVRHGARPPGQSTKCNPRESEDCACREGYRWHDALQKAQQMVSTK